MRFQPRALPEQHELNETNPVDLARQLPSRLLQRGGPPAKQRGRPVEKRGGARCGFQSSEQRVVVQPRRVLLDEVLEGAAQVRAGTRAEVLPCGLEQGVLEARD